MCFGEFSLLLIEHNKYVLRRNKFALWIGHTKYVLRRIEFALLSIPASSILSSNGSIKDLRVFREAHTRAEATSRSCI